MDGRSEEKLEIRREDRKSRKGDIAIYVMSALLLITLGLAALYGFKYGNVDQSTAQGSITVYKNDVDAFSIDIDAEMHGRVSYYYHTMTGTFVLAGAEEDSVLYQLRKIEFADGADASDVVLYVRMPRAGMQGDYSGPWMIYFSWPSHNEQRSDWVIANTDGTAAVGVRNNLNAITTQRSQLVTWSDSWTWSKEESRLQLFMGQDAPASL